MKKTAKEFIGRILWAQVRRLRKKNDFIVVAVAGSVGKTSTKLAIAQVLSASYKVRYQDGNYNDLVSVPLIFFGRVMPSLFNPFAWLVTIFKNEFSVLRKFPYDVVVVELGTDKPGDMAGFKQYLQVDLGVLTAITPEHMEFFADLDAVASEELVLAQLSGKLLVNKDLCPAKYLSNLPAGTLYYSIKQDANFKLANIVFNDQGADFDMFYNGVKVLSAAHEQVTQPQLYSICAAAAVAVQLEVPSELIDKGIRLIKPVSGRMQRLAGVNESVIIDDTYNASPDAVIAALDSLYRIKSAHKIAILGNMNELGTYSEAEHRRIGAHCDPAQLAEVITIGSDANKFLATVALDKGCKVKMFTDPYSAAKYLKPQLKQGSVLLAKGSQNGVFAEEAVKLLLADPSDAKKLVRQSNYWMKRKQKAFTSDKIEGE